MWSPVKRSEPIGNGLRGSDGVCAQITGHDATLADVQSTLDHTEVATTSGYRTPRVVSSLMRDCFRHGVGAYSWHRTARLDLPRDQSLEREINNECDGFGSGSDVWYNGLNFGKLGLLPVP
jgi:hypothetical protein